MNDIASTTPMNTTIPTTRFALPRTALYAAAATGLLAVGALAATLVLRGPHSEPPLVEAAKAPALAAAALPAPVLGRGTPTGPHTAAPATAPSRGVQGGLPERGGDAPVALATRPAADAPAPVCASCGTVESVNAVRQKGQATGVGAVAGGVLGGVVGHQIGGGNGRKAMTVLGAVGGGLAGHEIEKRQRSTTVYKITVRMDDGSRRILTRGESWAVGRRVSVEGSSLRALREPAPALDNTPRTLHTGAPA